MCEEDNCSGEIVLDRERIDEVVLLTEEYIKDNWPKKDRDFGRGEYGVMLFERLVGMCGLPWEAMEEFSDLNEPDASILESESFPDFKDERVIKLLSDFRNFPEIEDIIKESWLRLTKYKI